MEMKEENLPSDFAFNFFSPQAHQKFHILVFFFQNHRKSVFNVILKNTQPWGSLCQCHNKQSLSRFFIIHDFSHLTVIRFNCFLTGSIYLFSFTLQTAEAMAFSRDDSNVPEGSALSPRQQMLSSGAGALLVSLFMTPLDVVKIRLQVWIFNKIFQVIENLN